MTVFRQRPYGHSPRTQQDVLPRAPKCPKTALIVFQSGSKWRSDWRTQPSLKPSSKKKIKRKKKDKSYFYTTVSISFYWHTDPLSLPLGCSDSVICPWCVSDRQFDCGRLMKTELTLAVQCRHTGQTGYQRWWCTWLLKVESQPFHFFPSL